MHTWARGSELFMNRDAPIAVRWIVMRRYKKNKNCRKVHIPTNSAKTRWPYSFLAITFERMVAGRGLLDRKVELVETRPTVPISGMSGNIFGSRKKVVRRGRDPLRSIPRGRISRNIRNPGIFNFFCIGASLFISPISEHHYRWKILTPELMYGTCTVNLQNQWKYSIFIYISLLHLKDTISLVQLGVLICSKRIHMSQPPEAKIKSTPCNHSTS